MTASPLDLAVVGAGPAGAAAALGALAVDPTLRVALLDRAEFPRDKPCGDGVAPQALDVLAGVGVVGLLDDRVPVTRLRLMRDGVFAERSMTRPAYVVPRTVLDGRLHRAACAAGAVPVRHRARAVAERTRTVELDGGVEARLVVAADGVHSEVRRSLGLPRGPVAVALRGYAPTPPGRAGVQVIAFGTRRQPAYAWSFDRGDGLANVGYGELLTSRHSPPTRAGLLAGLEALLPGASRGAEAWRGHPLPLSTYRPLRLGRGRTLLAGDAAALVNPLTGEGIYYALATGLLAGRSAALALRADDGRSALTRYTSAARALLARHLRHTALASRLCLAGPVLDAGIRASARDQRVFDDLVELGLARGRLTTPVARGVVRGLVPTRHPAHHEER
jgi:geranylgeranyl reductase family protein